MLRVAFVGALAASFADRVRAHLAVPCEFLFSDEAEAAARLSEVDVLVSLVFTRAMGAAATRLRLVQVPGAGLDRIDRSALPPGAALANAYGHESGIAEYVLGAMLALSRGFARLDEALRVGVWESQWAPGLPAPPPWPELAGRTLGILGYGRIGQAVARRARAFDMLIRAVRRNAGSSAEDGMARVGGPETLDDLLRHSDYVAVTLALTPATRRLLGARELALLKPTAVLVNVARGEIVDEDALYEALAARRIAGAALDVWYRYPGRPRPDAARAAPLPRTAQCPHDPARIGLDGRDAGGPRPGHRGEHPARGPGRTPAEPDSADGVGRPPLGASQPGTTRRQRGARSARHGGQAGRPRPAGSTPRYRLDNTGRRGDGRHMRRRTATRWNVPHRFGARMPPAARILSSSAFVLHSEAQPAGRGSALANPEV